MTERCVAECRGQFGQLHNWPARFCSSPAVLAVTRPVVRQGQQKVAPNFVDWLSDLRSLLRLSNVIGAVGRRCLRSVRHARTVCTTGSIAPGPKPNVKSSTLPTRTRRGLSRTIVRVSSATPMLAPRQVKALELYRTASNGCRSTGRKSTCCTRSSTKEVSIAWANRGRRRVHHAPRLNSAHRNATIVGRRNIRSGFAPVSTGSVLTRPNSMHLYQCSMCSRTVTPKISHFNESRRCRCRSVPSSGGSACEPFRARDQRPRRCLDYVPKAL